MCNCFVIIETGLHTKKIIWCGSLFLSFLSKALSLSLTDFHPVKQERALFLFYSIYWNWHARKIK